MQKERHKWKVGFYRNFVYIVIIGIIMTHSKRIKS